MIRRLQSHEAVSENGFSSEWRFPNQPVDEPESPRLCQTLDSSWILAIKLAVKRARTHKNFTINDPYSKSPLCRLFHVDRLLTNFMVKMLQNPPISFANLQLCSLHTKPDSCHSHGLPKHSTSGTERIATMGQRATHGAVSWTVAVHVLEPCTRGPYERVRSTALESQEWLQCSSAYL